MADGAVSDVKAPGAEPMPEPAVSDVTFEVSLLSGASAPISAPSDATLGSLQAAVAEALGLAKGGEWPSLFFVRSSGEKEELPATATAGELAGEALIAGVQAEPEWCCNKAFSKSYMRGRRCGMEEDAEDKKLELFSGGSFTYWEKKHSHDAECGFNFDQTTDATGTWRLTRKKAKDAKGKDTDEMIEVICLEGTATRHTVEHFSRGCYDTPPGSDEEEGGEESSDGGPACRNRDETKTEPFSRDFAKADLLTEEGPKGRYVHSGWKVTDLRGSAPPPKETG